MYDPAAICRQLEKRRTQARVDLGASRGTAARRLGRIDLDGHAAALERRRTQARGAIPLRPTPDIVRQAEMEAAQAQHDLEMADPDCSQLDALRRRADALRARAIRLREAL